MQVADAEWVLFAFMEFLQAAHDGVVTFTRWADARLYQFFGWREHALRSAVAGPVPFGVLVGRDGASEQPMRYNFFTGKGRGAVAVRFGNRLDEDARVPVLPPWLFESIPDFFHMGLTEAYFEHVSVQPTPAAVAAALSSQIKSGRARFVS
ncbi:unnamed protein product [Agarophyton chilense]